MTVHRVEPGGPLRGRIRVPGDKSISHRVLMLAALADGTSTIRGLSDGGDVACTLRILEALGAELEEPFGTAPNDLALDAMSQMIEATLRELTGEVLPPAPQHKDVLFLT